MKSQTHHREWLLEGLHNPNEPWDVLEEETSFLGFAFREAHKETDEAITWSDDRKILWLSHWLGISYKKAEMLLTPPWWPKFLTSNYGFSRGAAIMLIENLYVPRPIFWLRFNFYENHDWKILWND